MKTEPTTDSEVLRLDLIQGSAIGDDSAYVVVRSGERCIAKVKASVSAEQGADGGFYPLVKVEQINCE